MYWQILANTSILAGHSELIRCRPETSGPHTPEQDAFRDEMLKTGEYHNASEAVRDAIRALQQRRALDALKLERLRQCIDAGIADLDNGRL